MNAEVLEKQFAPNLVASTGDTSALDVMFQVYTKVKEFLRDTIELPSKEVFLAAVGSAYDKHIAPIDLPGVNNLMEPWVDQALKAVLLRSVSGMHDSWQG